MKNNNINFLARVKIVRILLIFSICFLPLSLKAVNNDRYVQEKTFTFELINKSYRDFFNYIEKNSEFIFFYYDKTIDANKKISLRVENASILFVLNKLFQDTDIKYEIKDRQISLKKEGKVVPQKKKGEEQKRKVYGTVTDASSGESLVGVSILVEGADNGTITDLDGKFSIEVSSKTELVFSYIGYKKQTLLVGDLGVLNVKMKSDNEVLDEVVIVGAGTQKKVSVTGSIATVKGAELKLPSSSLTNGLTGRLAGVVSVATSGEPGSSSEFYIRGISTFGGRATPLILLDGVEISATDLDRIPAESIESFSILKDASATAIYGARGANGVMLVTTKSGIENTKAQINVSFENSFVTPRNMVEYADGATWMEKYNEAVLARTPGQELPYSQQRIDNTRAGVNPYVFPDVDWYDLLFKDMTMNQRANVNLQGGGQKVVYYMSLQANHDTGLLDIPNTNSFDNNINRWNYTFQNNISYKVTPTTKMELRMNAQIGNSKGPNYSTSDLFNYAYQTSPVFFPAVLPALEGDKHIRYGNAYLSSGRVYTNPYAFMSSSFKEVNFNTLNTSLSVEQKLDFITKGLKVKAMVNFKAWSESSYNRSISPWFYRVLGDEWSAKDPTTFNVEQIKRGSDYISESGLSRSSDNTFYFDARLDYNRRFGDHTVGAMLMYMQREFRNKVLPNRNQGLSGRFTYDCINKYLVEFNFGYNGTERLAKNDRFEFFPAVSLGWVISNEKFWEPITNYVDFLKLRTSYGLVGSDETGTSAGAAHFLYQNEVNMTNGYGFTTGSAGEYGRWGPQIVRLAVENAHWERVKKFNIGFDAHFFDQLNVTFDYFYDRRDRILMKRGTFPMIMGYERSIPWSNVGKVDNKGVELSVNWNKEILKDLVVDVRANMTYNINKYVYKDEPNYPYIWQMDTGKPLSSTVGYVADGLFKDQAEIDGWADMSDFGNEIMPGDIKYRDVNGDGRITEEDKVMISPFGNMPRIQYGFGLSVAYKNFDFGVFFNGSAQRKIMINNIVPFCASDTNGERNLMKWIADSHWSVATPNPNAAYPRLGIVNSQVSSNTVPSNYWMRNGNFLRFKTFEVGYRLPYCRIYVNGDNLAVWSPFKLWDPELNYNSYPLQRVINIGAQFTF